MENPGNWKQAERVIMDAIKQHDQSMQMGVTGVSLPRRIANALRTAGLMKEGE